MEALRGAYPRLYEVPFNSTNKHALCVVHPPSNEAPGKRYVLRKGAPESFSAPGLSFQPVATLLVKRMLVTTARSWPANLAIEVSKRKLVS